MKIKVAKYIAEFLISNGIHDCFMVTGGGAMHLDDALGHQKGMRCVFNHHEQACAIAAEGYARMTGRIAVVCVTSGPGGTNAVTGVMGGWVDSIPMLVLSGQAKREMTIESCSELGLRQLGDQEFDIIHSVSNMTKYAVMLTKPEETAYHLEKALYFAMNGRKGPVWLDIPLDVQSAIIDTEQQIHFIPLDEQPWGTVKPSSEIIDEILKRIHDARAPLLLAGTGIRLGGAEDLLLKVIEKLRIPVVTAWNANDTVAFDNPYFVGMPGTVGTRPGNFAVQNCDLLLSLGCRLNIRMIGYNHYDFAKNAFKIVVDIDPRELAKPTVRPDLPVCADVNTLMIAMLERDYAPPRCHERWLKWCRNLLEQYPSVPENFHVTGNSPINPYVFIEKLFSQLESDDRIVCGNGSACVITFQACRIKQGQRMFTNSGCAAMGYSLPAAIGVAVSDNSRRTICIDGDGSFMMNIQELATVAHNKLNVKLFIINNNGYLSIRQTQRNLFQLPYIGIDNKSGIDFPNFGKLADAFGLKYLRIENEDTADEVLYEVLNGKGPCICEIIVDPEQNFEPKSASRVLPDGRIVSPALDDMSPFLNREEYENIRYRVLKDG